MKRRRAGGVPKNHLFYFSLNTSIITIHKQHFLPYELVCGDSVSYYREMASTALRNVKVPPNSASLEEARHRLFEFFREACRSLPTVMEIYNLYDVVSVSDLRSSISSQIRKNTHVTDPKVIDMLLFKGMQELRNVVEHSKQRHHIIGQYVVGRRAFEQEELGIKNQGTSTFLKNFYDTNYF